MDTLFSGEVAGLLGTSIPTVRRAARRLGVGAIDDAGHLRLNERELAVLEADLGRVPRVDGLRRTHVQVLAALARAPLGLRSERAVARAARVSPTAAGRALDELEALDLVRHDHATLAEGEAVEAGLWRIQRGPAWSRIAPTVATTILPEPNDAAATPARVPQRLWHLFWNVEPATLDLEADADFIATRLLLSDDLQGIAWACSHLSDEALRAAARNRGATPAIRALVDNVLAFDDVPAAA